MPVKSAGSADKIKFLEQNNCLHRSIKLHDAGQRFQLVVLRSVKPGSHLRHNDTRYKMLTGVCRKCEHRHNDITVHPVKKTKWSRHSSWHLPFCCFFLIKRQRKSLQNKITVCFIQAAQ